MLAHVFGKECKRFRVAVTDRSFGTVIFLRRILPSGGLGPVDSVSRLNSRSTVLPRTTLHAPQTTSEIGIVIRDWNQG
jgi:hypothetical protein